MKKLSRLCARAHIKPVLVLPLLALISLCAVVFSWYLGPETRAQTTTSQTPIEERWEIRSALFNPIRLPGQFPLNQLEADELASIFTASDRAFATAQVTRESDLRRAVREIRIATLDELDGFIKRNPESGWNASLHSELAASFRKAGRITKALEHWDKTWSLTSEAGLGHFKLLADRALVNTASLLASLGRVEELEPLAAAYQYRVFREPHLAQLWSRTIEAFVTMRNQPDVAYRCGTFALDHVSRALSGTTQYVLSDVASPITGFSMAQLLDLSDELKLGLVAAVREPGASLIYPAVIHWKQNHYGALKRFSGGEYLIVDPTFPEASWITPEILDEEGSGYFLIPRNQPLPSGWRLASRDEAAQVFGRGYPAFIDDNTGGDECDPEDECCTEGPGADGTGDGGESCGTNSVGMATWKVREPNINLQISDTPMFYKAAFGPDFVLNLLWRQRNAQGVPLSRSHFAGWSSSILPSINTVGFVGLDECTLTLWKGDSLIYNLHFPDQSTTSDLEFNGGMRAVRTVVGSTITAITVYYRNGSVEKYSHPGGSHDYQLEWRKDATGKAISFTYDDPESLGYNTRLTTVTLADSTTTFTFVYNNPDVYLITGVNGPDSRAVTFSYGDFSGTTALTNITDTVNISSSFTYDESRWWITNLVTPYGTTSFDIVDNSIGTYLSSAGVDRSLVVTEPAGTKQVFLFYDNRFGTNEFGGIIPDAFTTNQVPTYGINDPPIQTLDLTRHRWNSHHWNRQQAAALSTLNVDNFTAADYRISRTKHWLVENHLENVMNSLRGVGWILLPAADGNTEPQPKFYDYAGKGGWGYWHFTGTNSRPAVVSQKRPDGTTWYRYFERNAAEMPTMEVERWEDNTTILYRTNETVYASGKSDPSIDDLLTIRKLKNGQMILGRALHNTYPHQIGQETNAVGDVTIFDYDSNLRLIAKTNQAGHISTYSYDGTSHRLTNVVESISGTQVRANSYTWLNGFERTHTDARGFTRTFDYDLLGRLTRITYADSTTETVSYSLPSGVGFNSSGSPLAILDPVDHVDRMGNKTRTLPNRNRQIETILEPSRTTSGAFGIHHTINYCGCGSPNSIIRDSTNSAETTTLYYDYQGHVTGVALPNGTWITNRYDVLGRHYVRADAISSATNVYDNLNRLVQRWNGAGLIEGHSYDSDDRIIVTTNSTGVVTTNVYDNLDRILDRSYPSGGIEKWRYTAGFSEPTSYTNQIGNVITWAYDAAQRRTNEVGVGIYTQSFTYSPANDLLVLLDGKTNRTMWSYDIEGRMQFKTNQSNVRVLTNAYNARGLLVASWTPAKGFRTNSYDKVGNLTQVVYSNTYYLNYQYDALSRLTNMTDAYGNTTFTYNGVGDLLTENGPFSNDTITYSYHGSVPSLRTNLSLQQPTGTWTQSYAYDDAKRLQSVTSPAGTFTYAYSTGVGSATNASPLWKKLAMFGSSSVYITNIFDSSGRLTDTALRNSADAPLNQHTYLHNAANQRTYETLPNASTRTNFYDAIGQLLRSDSSTATEDRGYKFDAAQNLNTRTNNVTPTTFNVNVRNELTSFSAAYDANGNLTNDTNRALEYDDENRLIQVTVAGTSRVAFGYDGLNRLRSQMFYSWNGSSWIWGGTARYIYDGQLVIQERNGDTPQVAYTRGTDLSGTLQGAGGIGGMLARSSTYQSGNFTNHHAYHADVGGNITGMVNTNQAISATYRYEPFGKLIASSGTMAGQNLYRFSSKMFVGGDLYHYGYRFYDPNYQRWINQDPLGEDGGLNLHAFVSNNPLTKVDPFGLSCLSQCAGEALGIGTAVGTTLTVGGLPLIKKPRGGFGGSKGTSPISKGLSTLLPQKMGVNLPAPTWKNPGARTAVLGRFLGRWVPVVGWGLLVRDAAIFAGCMSGCQE